MHGMKHGRWASGGGLQAPRARGAQRAAAGPPTGHGRNKGRENCTGSKGGRAWAATHGAAAGFNACRPKACQGRLEHGRLERLGMVRLGFDAGCAGHPSGTQLLGGLGRGAVHASGAEGGAAVGCGGGGRAGQALVPARGALGSRERRLQRGAHGGLRRGQSRERGTSAGAGGVSSPAGRGRTASSTCKPAPLRARCAAAPQERARRRHRQRQQQEEEGVHARPLTRLSCPASTCATSASTASSSMRCSSPVGSAAASGPSPASSSLPESEEERPLERIWAASMEERREESREAMPAEAGSAQSTERRPGWEGSPSRAPV